MFVEECWNIDISWRWIDGVGVLKFALYFELKNLPERELKKTSSRNSKKVLKTKVVLNTSMSTQFARHTWQIIGLKKAMLLRTRINWRSLLETITVRFWSIFTEKHAQRGEKNLNHLHWTTINGASLLGIKKFGNHSDRSFKHDQIAVRRIPWVPVLVVFFFNSDSSSWKF